MDKQHTTTTSNSKNKQVIESQHVCLVTDAYDVRDDKVDNIINVVEPFILTATVECYSLKKYLIDDQGCIADEV